MTAAVTAAPTTLASVWPGRADSVCRAVPMAAAAVCGLVAPAASWPTSELPKAVVPAALPAAVPAAVAPTFRPPSCMKTSLAPAITSTSSVPLNLPPLTAR